MSPIVTVNDLVFEYPGLRALDAVSFSIEPGTITALVGPNGAGKTTLMRCLCGLLRPLAGTIVVNGIDVIEAPRRCHQELGFLPDFIGLYDSLTVAQCLEYAAAANGVGRDLDSRVRTTAERLQLIDRLPQRAGELSRGLRQRLAIGQAIIHAPPLLILDEPASGLDPEARHALADLFRALQTQGMSLIVSSHILAELQDYATHMLVLRAGRMLEHRALGVAANTVLTLEVLTDLPTAAATLKAQAHVTNVEQDGSGLRFSFAGDATAQAELLRGLIAAGVPVVRFGASGSTLQESYLNSVRAPSSPPA